MRTGTPSGTADSGSSGSHTAGADTGTQNLHKSENSKNDKFGKDDSNFQIMLKT